MKLLDELRNNIIVLAAEKTEKKVDGRELTRNLDKQLDAFLGPGRAEKVKQGPLTNLLFEAIEGLYEDKPAELVPRVMQWIVDIRKAHGQKEEPEHGPRNNFGSKPRS